MKIEYKKLSLIHLNPENPRLIKDGKFTKLCESIKNFPRMLELRPIIVDDLGEILAGNQRYRACKELGIKEVPVLLASDLTDEQKQEFIVKDNISSGEWDWNMLSTQFDSDMLEDWGLDVFPEDLEESKKEAQEDDFDVPEIDQVKTNIKYGDIIQIGNHRLMCGDSTKKEDVEKLMDGKKAYMVFTDPPYALFGNSTGVAGIVDDNMVRPFFKSIMIMFKQYTEIFGHIYMCCDWHSAFSIEGCAKEVELKAKNMCIWDKGDGGVGAMYQQCYEIIWFFDNSPTNKTTMRTVKGGVRTVNGVPNIWRAKRVQVERQHNAQKPIDLISIPIINGSDKKSLVLDLFLGSGSTMVACHQLDRICYGMELEPKYCQVIIDRMKKLDPNIEIKHL